MKVGYRNSIYDMMYVICDNILLSFFAGYINIVLNEKLINSSHIRFFILHAKCLIVFIKVFVTCQRRDIHVVFIVAASNMSHTKISSFNISFSDRKSSSWSFASSLAYLFGGM